MPLTKMTMANFLRENLGKHLNILSDIDVQEINIIRICINTMGSSCSIIFSNIDKFNMKKVLEVFFKYWIQPWHPTR